MTCGCYCSTILLGQQRHMDMCSVGLAKSRCLCLGIMGELSKLSFMQQPGVWLKLLDLRRFPSGTATANVIRTLFGVPRELPRQVVAEVEQAASTPVAGARQLLPTHQPAAQHAAPGTPRTPTTPQLERGRSGGADRGRATPSPTGGKLSGRRFSTDDIPFLDLRSAASLARADTASMLPSSRIASGSALPFGGKQICQHEMARTNIDVPT